MKKLLLSTLALLLMATATAQQISGRVISAVDKSPIIGATVLARESQRATATDKDGRFTLSISPVDRFLDISYIGMTNVELPITSKKVVYDCSMSESFSKLDEVVVIGYGTMLKRDVTGAITSLSASEIEQNSGGNLNTALQGKIPGLQIVQTSGEPGAGANITIRGASSLSGGTEPLYVIDGVIIETGNFGALDKDEGATFSPISGLNPNDIESVEVLKDASSAAIYGSRAANGVIIITTKGGQKLGIKPATVTLGHTSSIVSNSRNLDVLNGQEYRDMYASARINAGLSWDGRDYTINPYKPTLAASTDWQSLLFQTAYQSRTDINVNGSSEGLAYSVSLGYRDLQPTMSFTSYDQLNARANFTYKISKHITAGTRISYTYQKYKRVLTGESAGGGMNSVLNAIVRTQPVYTPYDPNTGQMLYWLGITHYNAGYDIGEVRNPLALAKYSPYNLKRDWMILSQYFDFNLYKGLKLKVQGSMEADQNIQDRYQAKEFYNIDTRFQTQDFGYYQDNMVRRLLLESFLTYNYKSKNKRHNMTFLGGASYESSKSNMYRLNGRFYLDGESSYIQNAQVKDTYQIINDRTTLSFFGRANYNYRDRYIAAVTFRRDGSSRFGPDNRWANFPSASLGWRISSEKFMGWAKGWLQDAKIRGSWGQLGNQSIGNYDWQGLYSVTANNYDGQRALLYDVMPNSGLRWETTTQTNVGLDLSMFGGRVAFTFDAYRKVSKDLLFNLPTEYYTGFSQRALNFGKLQNKGLEFLLETINFANPNGFRWSTSFNISFNRNKILELATDEAYLFGGVSIAKKGYPAGMFYTLRWDGIWGSSSDNVYTGPNAEATGGVYRKGSSNGQIYQGGDVKWYDATGDGVINDEDRVIVGNPNPKFIGGFGNTFSYKQLSLNVFFQFSYGNMVMNEFLRNRSNMYEGRNTSRLVLQSWQKEGDVALMPRLVSGDPMQNVNGQPSSFWMEDGSFLRMKDVTLTYNIKPKKRIFIKEVKLQFTMTNLLTWSKYRGYDPEVNTSDNPLIMGLDRGAYPKARSYNFGVNLTF